MGVKEGFLVGVLHTTVWRKSPCVCVCVCVRSLRLNQTSHRWASGNLHASKCRSSRPPRSRGPSINQRLDSPDRCPNQTVNHRGDSGRRPPHSRRRWTSPFIWADVYRSAPYSPPPDLCHSRLSAQKARKRNIFSRPESGFSWQPCAPDALQRNHRAGSQARLRRRLPALLSSP